jgi:hypothetical protein
MLNERLSDKMMDISEINQCTLTKVFFIKNV